MTERDDETRKDLGIHREPEILVTDASAKNTSMVHHIVGSLLIPSQMPIMEADNNNTYDLDTQIQELLTASGLPLGLIFVLVLRSSGGLSVSTYV